MPRGPLCTPTGAVGPHVAALERHGGRERDAVASEERVAGLGAGRRRKDEEGKQLEWEDSHRAPRAVVVAGA
jgi:hypothetical protein